MEKLELTQITDKIRLYKGDSMDFLKQVPDKYYELAIIDPPYGIGESGKKNHTRGKIAKSKNYKPFEGEDAKPSSLDFFRELKRVSKNQIIWGANHFIENIPNPNSSCWIVWDKDNGMTDFADSELAYTSFSTSVRNFKFKWQGMLQEDMKNKEIRIHPTQKPVALYKWLLDKYAQEGYKILDTHGGSMSIAIACHDYEFELDLIELDEDYYKAGVERVQNHVNQLKLF